MSLGKIGKFMDMQEKICKDDPDAKYGRCPFCEDSIVSARSNFCASCGHQLRELAPEDATIAAPEAERWTPMPVATLRVPTFLAKLMVENEE